MATPYAPAARLSAVAAVALGLGLAWHVPTGPWQPASLILGGLALVVLVLGLVTGSVGAVAGATVVFLIRVGIHGLAGDRGPGLVMTTVLILAMIELADHSFSARTGAVDLRSTMWWGVATVVFGAVTMAVTAPGPVGERLVGPWLSLAGVGAAVAAASVVLVVRRSIDVAVSPTSYSRDGHSPSTQGGRHGRRA